MKSLSNEGILLREYLSRYYANNRSIQTQWIIVYLLKSISESGDSLTIDGKESADLSPKVIKDAIVKALENMKI